MESVPNSVFGQRRNINTEQSRLSKQFPGCQ